NITGKYMWEMAKWRRRHRIPERCSVRPWGSNMRSDAAKARKPLYVDFAASQLLAVFAQKVDEADFVVLDEPLPSVEDGESASLSSGRLAEFIVEVGDGHRC